MTAEMKFTVLDDTNHVIGPAEYTVCGLVIPHGNGYVTETPDKVCGDCLSRAADTDEFGAGDLSGAKRAKPKA